jgi:hypothetical protein
LHGLLQQRILFQLSILSENQIFWSGKIWSKSLIFNQILSMKQLFTLLLLTFSANCQAQFQVSDTSLKIDTTSLITPCDCNTALILHMKEVIALMEEVKRIQKKGPEMTSLMEEIRKRDIKHYEFFTRCMPIYNAKGSQRNCPNNEEGEALDKKGNALRKELGMQ